MSSALSRQGRVAYAPCVHTGSRVCRPSVLERFQDSDTIIDDREGLSSGWGGCGLIDVGTSYSHVILWISLPLLRINWRPKHCKSLRQTCWGLPKPKNILYSCMAYLECVLYPTI